MELKKSSFQTLSPRWRHGVFWTIVIGMSILIYISATAYRDAPPIPEGIVSPSGEMVFTGRDISEGQEVFLKYGLMENGTIWGHGAYLGPDFSAEYLHTLGVDARDSLAQKLFKRDAASLSDTEKEALGAEVKNLLKTNRYDPKTKTLIFSEPEVASYRKQIGKWTDYFSGPTVSGGLPMKYIEDKEEIRKLTAFFAWAAWASVADRPGKSYSYTNNFPYDPLVGNTLTRDAVLWSALSIITLLGATALVLFIFGRFDYLGWKGHGEGVHIHPHLLPGVATESQKATIKYFVIVSLLFLAQVLVGAATAHFRADPGNFYGIDLSWILPSNLVRTWHLQLAIFWIATAYVAGGLLLAPSLGGKDPNGQVAGINALFWALVLVVVGSLLGEMFGIRQILGKLWFLFGHQGWEFLDLGRGWQVLLTIGLLFWLFLLYRAVAPARKDEERSEIATLFMLGAIAIPFFYLPAFFFGSKSNFSVVDMWRFWIIHLWVEGFFELFVTVLVAVIFYQLGMVARKTAVRIIYLDAILFLGSGIVGTAHHWYWTGQSNVTMALAATFSAMEVVPLTLLTLDAWDFVKLTGTQCEVCGKGIVIPHKWTFYFLMAVGFWNFLGAAVFGFLINLPVVSYFEVGTMLTPNHGHAAFMGAFGMLAMALLVLSLRQVLTDEQWVRPEKFIRISFWGLNIGLLLMVLLSLFPGGVMQFWDVLTNGYWHARGLDYTSEHLVRLVEWMRMPGDVVFIVLGVVPAVLATALAYRYMWAANR
ncbi:nitric-oxide reductase large subunit [Desulforhabdus amnigena]|jgi:nitric oxide reductase subunit B|uniref:Nitric oxide reductase n=1 Tax=Desulforhabdus amnigena TaxID=40218 RepID=A0A9W6D142_9BACT|nr:cbb3-type cytochrome c oxidase subunit I [Desulforhabdus amnigena]NLJ28772.1 nitric-oxide reductase large subunit [Deltaproteobacteria bacterium]GLI34162.1 nitric oxide reductase [Desulforhabdus amnigena]